MKPVSQKPNIGQSTCIPFQTILFSLFLIIFASVQTKLHAQVVAGQTCETAIEVTPGSHTADGPSAGEGAVNACDFTILGTHAEWYEYTPPATGMINISSCMGGADTRLSVLTGNCNNLNCYAENDDSCPYSSSAPGSFASEITNLTVQGGTTYYIQWDNRWSNSGFDWTLDYTPETPSNNGPCNNIVYLDCGDSQEGTTYGADASGFTLPCTGSGSGKDVFYHLNTTIGETYTVTLTGEDIDGVLSAYNGSCLGVVDLLDCSDNFGTGVSESITFTNPSAAVVYIRVFNYFSDGGNFELAVSCASVTNDDCSGAESITVDDAPISGSNAQASIDPDLSIDCAALGETEVQHGVWYSFDAPETGKIIIETFAGTLTDSQLQVYDACGGNVVACDDDAGMGLMSKITLNCDTYTPTQTYYILVDGWGESQGSFDISVVTEACPAPANDACANSTSIAVDAAPIEVTNSGATGSPDITIPCGFGEYASTNDVWFSFVAPSSGEVTIETFAGILTDSQLQIFDVCGGDVIACDEDGGESLMSKITLACDSYIPGNTYLVQVDGWEGAVGTFSISVTSSPCPAPDNDACADAISLAVNAHGDCAGNEVSGTTSGATSDGLSVGCEPGNSEVFYSFNSGANTSVLVNVDAITITDIVLTVKEESCTGTQVYCFGNDSPYTFEVSPNTDYIVRVSTNTTFGYQGSFSICVEDGYDCPLISANIGDSCDDGDPNTENDVVTASCTCEGTSASYGTLSGTIPSWNSSCGSRDVTIGLAQPAAGFYDELYGTLNADGSIDLDGSPEIIAGTYTVFVDVEGALVKSVGEVVISSGSNTFSVPPLTFGDLNNDNAINISDISQFITTFGSAIGDSNYDPLADFDCSGSINIADLSSLTNNFGLSGDNLIL